MATITSTNGVTQLNRMLVGRLLISPAAMWNGTIAANVHAQIVVSRRLIALNFGEFQSC